MASNSGMDGLRSSLRINVSIDFLNTTTSSFVLYLTDPLVRQISNGQYLKAILEILVDPPTVWNAFFAGYKARLLDQNTLLAFAWLLSELILLPDIYNAQFLRVAELIVQDGLLLHSPNHEIRTLHHRIEKVLGTLTTVVSSDSEHSPGGRHDNDFAEYRKIAIFPTADEFLSSEAPFYRQADALYEVEPHLRASLHLDNQFRLLREDLLAQLREGLQVATGRKKGKRTSLILRKLAAVSLSSGDHDRRKPCTLAVKCRAGLEQMTSIPLDQRKAFLKNTRHFLKHQSFGCLIHGKEIVAFATVSRDDDDLIKEVPIVHLQVLGETAFRMALLAFKGNNDLQFILVDTPFFAYEPILRCLQEKKEVPFTEELFTPETASGFDGSRMFPHSALVELVKCRHGSVKQCLDLSKEVILEDSQMNSIISGLQNSLSLIQGPPGNMITLQHSLHIDSYRHRKIIHWSPSCQINPSFHKGDDFGYLFYESCSRSVP